MLIGEPDAWILSIAFLDDDSKLMRLCIDLPDRPGALHEIMKVMGEESINVLAGYTNVLVYYERMTSELVVDARGASGKAKGDIVEVLRGRIASLGPSFKLVEAAPVKP